MKGAHRAHEIAAETPGDREFASREFACRELAALDGLVAQPKRLAMLHALAGGGEADYPLLQSITGLTTGALSAHVRRLEDAGLIEVRKVFEGRRPKTWFVITPAGKRAEEGYWRQTARLREEALRRAEATDAGVKKGVTDG